MTPIIFFLAGSRRAGAAVILAAALIGAASAQPSPPTEPVPTARAAAPSLDPASATEMTAPEPDAGPPLVSPLPRDLSPWAAIPAVVIYNIFPRSIASYRALCGDGTGEILRLVSRDLARAEEGGTAIYRLDVTLSAAE
jgi:hypothetical protein